MEIPGEGRGPQPFHAASSHRNTHNALHDIANINKQVAPIMPGARYQGEGVFALGTLSVN